MRHWTCCEDDGELGLCGTDLSGIPWCDADELVAASADVDPCEVCLQMMCDTPCNRCPRHQGRPCADQKE